MSSIKDDLLNNPVTYGLISGLVIIVINLSIASIAEGSLEKGYQLVFRINDVFIYLVPIAVSVQMGLFKYHKNITSEKKICEYERLGLTGSLISLLAMFVGYFRI